MWCVFKLSTMSEKEGNREEGACPFLWLQLIRKAKDKMQQGNLTEPWETSASKTICMINGLIQRIMSPLSLLLYYYTIIIVIMN